MDIPEEDKEVLDGAGEMNFIGREPGFNLKLKGTLTEGERKVVREMREHTTDPIAQVDSESNRGKFVKSALAEKRRRDMLKKQERGDAFTDSKKVEAWRSKLEGDRKKYQSEHFPERAFNRFNGESNDDTEHFNELSALLEEDEKMNTPYMRAKQKELQEFNEDNGTNFSLDQYMDVQNKAAEKYIAQSETVNAAPKELQDAVNLDWRQLPDPEKKNVAERIVDKLKSDDEAKARPNVTLEGYYRELYYATDGANGNGGKSEKEYIDEQTKAKLGGTATEPGEIDLSQQLTKQEMREKLTEIGDMLADIEANGDPHNSSDQQRYNQLDALQRDLRAELVKF